MGRQDSNLGMAKSKSDYFSLFLNRYSEKDENTDTNNINILGVDPEWMFSLPVAKLDRFV